jgi:hypothetical protein
MLGSTDGDIKSLSNVGRGNHIGPRAKTTVIEPTESLSEQVRMTAVLPASVGNLTHLTQQYQFRKCDVTQAAEVITHTRSDKAAIELNIHPRRRFTNSIVSKIQLETAC